MAQKNNQIRQAILRELKARGWSRYKFAQELKGQASASFIFAFLRGASETNTDTADVMLRALGLTVGKDEAAEVANAGTN